MRVRRLTAVAGLVWALCSFAGCLNFGPEPGEKLNQLFLDVTRGRAVRRALKNLNADESQVRLHAILRLARADCLEAASPISLMLDENTEPAPLVRCAAAVALRRIGDARALPRVRRAVQDPHPFVRRDVVHTLGVLGARSDLPGLGRIARTDADEGVRLQAVESIGLIGGPKAIEMLIALVENQDELIAYTANHQLALITGRDLGPSVRLWKAWWEKNKGRPLKAPRQGRT